MPHRAEPRVVGRHRREQAPRHRAARPAYAVPITGERGRTAMLTATLSAALIVGGGSGTATASAGGGTPASTEQIPPPALRSYETSQADVAARPLLAGQEVSLDADAPDGRLESTGVPAGAGVRAGTSGAARLSAAPMKRKPRPLPTLGASRADAAWVNPNPAAVVTSCFGPRWGRVHEGVDLAAPDRTPIVAAGAGVVVRAGEAEGYGIAVLIDHGNGYLTHYGHLSAISVRAGQRVKAGQQIGNEGSTGHSTGPHLHFEVHQGVYKNPVEPIRWLHEHGVDIPGCAPAGG